MVIITICIICYDTPVCSTHLHFFVLIASLIVNTLKIKSEKGHFHQYSVDKGVALHSFPSSLSPFLELGVVLQTGIIYCTDDVIGISFNISNTVFTQIGKSARRKAKNSDRPKITDIEKWALF